MKGEIDPIGLSQPDAVGEVNEVRSSRSSMSVFPITYPLRQAYLAEIRPEPAHEP